MEFHHKPVLFEETIQSLAIRPEGLYIDGTMGGGGQVTYVNVAQEDQGTVVREATSGSFWENLWSAIQSWFQ